MMDSIAYYDENAAEFFKATCDIDMSSLYEEVVPSWPKGGKILDAGCGSGRDALAFRKLGFDVTAFDASEAMVGLACQHTGIDVKQMTFDQVEWVEEFDGVWACASLLHVPRVDLVAVLQKLVRALTPKGALYVSFKYGAREVARDGRVFTCLDELALGELVAQVPAVTAAKVWVSEDLRPEHAGERWLNALIGRPSSPNSPSTP